MKHKDVTRTSQRPRDRFLAGLPAATFTALYAALLCWEAPRADDAQIYFHRLPSAQAPRVLFSIDTSGSMTSRVPGEGRTRLEAVKDALTGLIHDRDDLKAGLSRFHRELGGSIIFPAVDPDAAPELLDDAALVIPVDRSSDDAGEARGVVTLNGTALEVSGPAPGDGSAVTTLAVSARAAGGDGTGSPDIGRLDAGFRFPDVDVPRNAIILHAEIGLASGAWRSGDAELVLYGHDVDDSRTFVDPPPGRLTTARVHWRPAAGNDADPDATPNIRSIVQEIVNRSGWAAQNDMRIIFRAPAGRRGVSIYDGGAPPVLRIRYVEHGTVVERRVDGSGRDANETSAGGLENALTMLHSSQGGPYSHTGLIFRDLSIPEAAAVVWADIGFTTGDGGGSASAELSIHGIEEPRLDGFGKGERISEQPLTAARVDWLPARGGPLHTPDLTALVEEIRADTSFMAGDNLGFVIRGAGGSETCSFDGVQRAQDCPEDPTARPTLQLVYALPAEVAATPRQVGLRFNNVQVPRGATINSAFLELRVAAGSSETGTLDIEIEDDTAPLTYSGEPGRRVSDRHYGPSAAWDAGAWSTIGETRQSPDIASLVSSVTDQPGWCRGGSLAFRLTSDDTGFIARAFDQGEGGSPTLRIDYTTGSRGADDTCAGGPAAAAMAGVVDELTAGGWTPTVDALFEAAAYFEGGAVHFGRTRGAGRSYESTGVTQDGDLDPELDGRTDAGLLVQGELSRLSHTGSWEPAAAIRRHGSCTALDPNHPDCRSEHIDNGASPAYLSPLADAGACERGYLVLVSDGIANRNSSRDLIQRLTGRASCPLDIPRIDPATGEALRDSDGGFKTRDPSPAELCGLELAGYLRGRDDMAGGLPGTANSVRTFTVGFDLDPAADGTDRQAVEFLKALAFTGGGGDLDQPGRADDPRYGDGFHAVRSGAGLRAVLETILDEVLRETTSLTAPGLSVNMFNRLYNLDDVYFSLFRPDDKTAWRGNLKKFKLCTDQASCEFGETIDKYARPAVHRDESHPDFGTLKSTATGFWSDDFDGGRRIDAGGAGELIPTHTQRNVYVSTIDGDVPAPDHDGDPVWAAGTPPHRVNLAADTGPPPASPADFNDLKAALRTRGNCNAGPLAAQNACLNDLIAWITGKRFLGDPPRDVSNDEDTDRWAFGDPMHSRPLVLTYGRDQRSAADPDDDVALSKIFVGTNDGGIRMINEGDGIEEWIFFPNSMLAMQSLLKRNPPGGREYGIDDTPVARISDADGDAVIEPEDGDFAHLYFGLRRGGRQLFALNVTPDTTVGLGHTADVNGFPVSVAEKDKIHPELLWRIDGTDADFRRLGDTWSTPRPVRVAGSAGPRSVLVFGGGYDTAQDGTDHDGTAPDGGDRYHFAGQGDAAGNAVYIVDAGTGKRLWWASSDPGADAVVPEMNAPIAAPVSVLDADEDGLTDRLYAVDLRGRVFRVDIKAGPGSGQSELADSTVGLLAVLGPDESGLPPDQQAPNADRRKFFYAPEVARVTDTVIAGEPYELIGLVSGNRAQPGGATVADRAYAVRDFLVDNPADGLDDSNFPRCNPRAVRCPASGEPITHSELQDVTDRSTFIIRARQVDGTITPADPSGENAPNDPGSALDELKQSHGWFFDLEGTGEKGFSPATVLDGRMFFTTFVPSGDSDGTAGACAAPKSPGVSRFYAVDFFTGAPSLDRNRDARFDEEERYTTLGTGPSADLIPAFLPGGIVLPVPTGAGSLPRDPRVSEMIEKTFWFEEK